MVEGPQNFTSWWEGYFYWSDQTESLPHQTQIKTPGHSFEDLCFQRKNFSPFRKGRHQTHESGGPPVPGQQIFFLTFVSLK
jgi:hypothetical protein